MRSHVTAENSPEQHIQEHARGRGGISHTHEHGIMQCCVGLRLCQGNGRVKLPLVSHLFHLAANMVWLLPEWVNKYLSNLDTVFLTVGPLQVTQLLNFGIMAACTDTPLFRSPGHARFEFRTPVSYHKEKQI